MNKLNLKYKASTVDEIEKAKQTTIENCMSDTSISTLCLFVQKGLIDENGNHGVSKHVAMNVIDEYLQEYDKDDLVLDIMEALINGGFLSRQVNISELRKNMKKKMSEVNTMVNQL